MQYQYRQSQANRATRQSVLDLELNETGTKHSPGLMRCASDIQTTPIPNSEASRQLRGSDFLLSPRSLLTLGL